MEKDRYHPPPLPKSYNNNVGRDIARLWHAADGKWAMQGNVPLQRKIRIAAYRAAAANAAEGDDLKQLSKSLKWRLNQWNEEQRLEHRGAMRQGHRLLLKRVKGLEERIEEQLKGN